MAPEDEPTSFVEKRVSIGLEPRALTIEKTKTILLCGRLQNPVLQCMRGLSNTSFENATVIPIVAKLNQGVQKFKIPFKAVHADSPETDFEFIFIKSVQPDASEDQDSLEKKQFIVFNCMTFFCLPAVLKVGPNAPSVLSVQLQMNTEKLAQLPTELLQM